MNLQRLTDLAKELTTEPVWLTVERQLGEGVIASIRSLNTRGSLTVLASASAETEEDARKKLEAALVLAVRERLLRSLDNEQVAAFARRARLLGDLK